MWSKLAISILKPAVRGLTKVESKLIKVSSKLSGRTTKTAHNVAGTFEPIMPPELKSLRQMKCFNKSAFGVKVFDVQDKEFGKFLTDGMTNFYNKTGGQFGVPKNVIVCDLPNANGFMMYEPTKDILAISRKHIEEFRKIATLNGETLEQVLKNGDKLNLMEQQHLCMKRVFSKSYFMSLGIRLISLPARIMGI